MHASTVRTVRLRAIWLAVNLLTAVIASLVIAVENASRDRGARRAEPIVLDGRNAAPDHRRGAGAAMGELTGANMLRFIVRKWPSVA